MAFGHTGYAQSGTRYQSAFAGCVHRWAEQATSGGFVDYYIGGCSTPGETHSYWQQAIYDAGGLWHERSNIDLTIIHQSTWSPFNTWGGTFHVAFSAETYYAQTHIPGLSTAKQDFSGMQVQDRINDSWYDTCGNAFLGSYNQNSPRWGVDAPNCNHTRSWTN